MIPYLSSLYKLIKTNQPHYTFALKLVRYCLAVAFIYIFSFYLSNYCISCLIINFVLQLIFPVEVYTFFSTLLYNTGTGSLFGFVYKEDSVVKKFFCSL